MSPAAYAAADKMRVILNPKDKAVSITRTELTTEEQPFTHHAHGIILILYFSKSFIPAGNGIPIKNPRGKRRIKEMICRIMIPSHDTVLNRYGKNRAYKIIMLHKMGSAKFIENPFSCENLPEV